MCRNSALASGRPGGTASAKCTVPRARAARAVAVWCGPPAQHDTPSRASLCPYGPRRRRNGVLDNRRSAHPLLEVVLDDVWLRNESFEEQEGPYAGLLMIDMRDVAVFDLIPSCVTALPTVEQAQAGRRRTLTDGARRAHGRAVAMRTRSDFRRVIALWKRAPRPSGSQMVRLDLARVRPAAPGGDQELRMAVQLVRMCG